MKIAFRTAVVAFVLAFAVQFPIHAAETPLPEAVPVEKKILSYVQLRNLLMDFADEYMQIIGQAADTLQKKNADPGSRVGIHSLKLFPCSAAFVIATDSNPHMALLDMVVLVHLQGSVWKETLPKRFGGLSAPLLASQEQLETDIDTIAERALGADQLEKLKKLVVDWRQAHPDQHYVSYIRFSDFSETQGGQQPRRRPQNLLSIGGLLSAFQLVNMDETTRSVDQARMLGERALYLSERMPTMIRWQTEMFLYEFVGTPELRNIFDFSKALSSEGHALIWDAATAAMAVAFVVFLLALLYRYISKKI